MQKILTLDHGASIVEPPSPLAEWAQHSADVEYLAHDAVRIGDEVCMATVAVGLCPRISLETPEAVEECDLIEVDDELAGPERLARR